MKKIINLVLLAFISLFVCFGMTSCNGGINPFKEPEQVTVYLRPKTILEEHPTILNTYVLDKKLLGDVCEDKAIYEHLKTCFYFVDPEGQKVELPVEYYVHISEQSDNLYPGGRTDVYETCEKENYNLEAWIICSVDFRRTFEVKKGNKIITYKMVEGYEESCIKFQTIFEGK